VFCSCDVFNIPSVSYQTAFFSAISYKLFISNKLTAAKQRAPNFKNYH
jgi:hypothetical protein